MWWEEGFPQYKRRNGKHAAGFLPDVPAALRPQCHNTDCQLGKVQPQVNTDQGGYFGLDMAGRQGGRSWFGEGCVQWYGIFQGCFFVGLWFC